MGLYNIDYNGVVQNLLPPFLRKPIWSAWLNSMVKPIQWCRNILFDNWYESYIYTYVNYQLAFFTIIDAYTLCRFQDNSVWITLVDNVDAIAFDPTKGKTTDLSGNVIWYKVLSDCIGFRERLSYNNQKIIFEFLLNRYFNPLNYNDLIYIDTMQINYMFEIGETYVNILDSVVIAETDDDSVFYISETDDENLLYNFIIWVPLQISIDMGINYKAIISSIADKYNYYGLIYDIQTY